MPKFVRSDWGSSWWPREKHDAICWIIGWLTVVPLAQIRCLDIYYQTYLYKIFHRRPVSQVGHFLTSPAILFFVTLGLSTVRWEGVPLTLGDLFTLGMVGFYGILCAVNRLGALFVLMAAAMGAFRVASELMMCHFADRGLLVLALVALASFLQALSHIAEEALPPFVGGRADAWTRYTEYWDRSVWLWLGVRLYTVATTPLWTLLEFVSTPRVFAVQGLLVLVGMGFYKDFAVDITEVTDHAIQMGNKAPLVLPERGEPVLSSAEVF